MTIRHQTWRKFTRVGSMIAVPFVLSLFLRPHWGVWNHPLEIVSYIVLFLLAGSGDLGAILIRSGMIRMIRSFA